MAVTLTGAGGLFTILKDAFTALESLNLAQGTTVPDDIDDILAEMADNDTVDGDELAKEMVAALKSHKRSAAMQSAIRTFCRKLIIDRVTADAPQIPANITDCITELIRQMEASSDTVERNVVTAVVSSSPTDAPDLYVDPTAGNGKNSERILAETLVGEFASATSLRITSGKSEPNKLLPDWPAGSSINKTLSVDDVGLLLNPSFDDETELANKPDEWIVEVGSVGTSVSITNSEVQTITVTGGPPTSGTWTISHTRADGFKQTTDPLAFDATAATVQAALREFVGFADVTVTLDSSVYTVNFNAVSPPGDQTLLTTTNTFDVGSLVVAEDTAGEDSFTYKALAFTGDGAELTEVRQRIHDLDLLPSTSYHLSVRVKVDSATTGTLNFALIDGAAALINDDEGTANEANLDLSTVSTMDFEAKPPVFFRTPATMPEVAYLRIKASVAIANTKTAYLDDAIFSQAEELYPNGPVAALIASTNDLQDGDRYVVTATNDLAGRIQTWFWRLFNRVLPSDVSASETIPDT